MGKRIVVHFYGDAVIETDSFGEAISIVEKLVKVDSSGYGKERRLVEVEESGFDFEIVNESQFIRRNNEQGMLPYLTQKVNELEKSLNDANQAKWKAQNEVSDIKKETECLKKEIEIIRSVKPEAEAE